MASLTGGRLWIAGVVISAVALWAPDAGAGLFRCTRPDGRVVYTDNQAACPGAAPHEPTGTVQHIESAPAALRSARPRAIRGSAAVTRWAGVI